jgi:4-amino-4-deoxy-L-arabinose transferase-like glycosyltransferase
MSNLSIPYQENEKQKSWLMRPIIWKITPALILICLITLLSAGLHIYNIQSIGNSNAYYTAAVKSMLQSWHNFFFVSAEPGGSVTVDKPPLGLWIETAFAAVLGVSGFSVVLPNILAGVFSVPTLYHLIKKYFDASAGLIAALVLSLTPVSVAVDRNNTIDGMLIFTLLLAAWAFIKATETGELKHLLLGVFLVGLGFNIKMMQAILPLPAFYALYIFGAKTVWKQKVLNIALASILLVVVSFLWAVIVDMTPVNQRPYVGSTSTNSEMELIFGYNGINRLKGMMGGRNRTAPFGQVTTHDNTNRVQQNPGGVFQPGGMTNPNGIMPSAPSANQMGGSNQPPQGFEGIGRPNGNGGGSGMFNTGTPGVLRFFQAPLAKEMSWLLPFGLISLLLAAFAGLIGIGGLKKFSLPVESQSHKALIIWGGWLVTCLIFFSIAGFFHSYYLATLSPALAAIVGIGFYILKENIKIYRIVFGGILFVSAGLTIVFQLYLVNQFGLNGIWNYVTITIFGIGALIAGYAFLKKSDSTALFNTALISMLFAMLIIPGIWSVRTVSANTATLLPEAYSGDGTSNNRSFAGSGNSFATRASFGGSGNGQNGNTENSTMLSFLEQNTMTNKYLVAVSSSNSGSNLVLETGRPVLFMGGFSGSDPVVNASSLAKLVSEGELRYILYGGMGGFGGGGNSTSDVSIWIQSNCSTVTQFSQTTGSGMRGGMSGSTLYQCGS